MLLPCTNFTWIVVIKFLVYHHSHFLAASFDFTIFWPFSYSKWATPFLQLTELRCFVLNITSFCDNISNPAEGWLESCWTIYLLIRRLDSSWAVYFLIVAELSSGWLDSSWNLLVDLNLAELSTGWHKCSWTVTLI